MTVKVLAFGIAKEIFGSSAIELSLDDNTVAGLKAKLEEKYPRLKQIASYAVAVNNEYAADNLELKANDEIAVIPPVSGG
jgi:molybdopterin converting factor subunit 1